MTRVFPEPVTLAWADRGYLVPFASPEVELLGSVPRGTPPEDIVQPEWRPHELTPGEDAQARIHTGTWNEFLAAWWDHVSEDVVREAS